MIQQAIVYVVVAGAAAWLLWTFAPTGLRRSLIARARPRTQAVAKSEASNGCACGSDDGCGH